MSKREDILRAVRANRAGLAEASDSAVIQLYNSLDKETQETYLNKTKNEGKSTDADRNGS
jgi:hypothetical protein